MRSRALIFVMALAFAAFSRCPAQAVAQWSRLYNMPCQGCHTTYPRLNMVGLQFRRNGYRFAYDDKAEITSRNLSSYVGPTWTPATTQTGERTNASLVGTKIHIGGPVGRSAGFLVQPTPGSRADFNLVQGMTVFGTDKQSYRLVGGRVLGWLNGGSVGAGDRAIGATVPRMFAELHGISPGGIGNGARFEVNWEAGTTLAVYTSDMEATSRQSQTTGMSLIFPLSGRTVSALELFTAYGSVPVKGKSDVQAVRSGLLINRWLGTAKQPEQFNLLAGVMYGFEDRVITAHLPTNFWTGFLEQDWQARPGLTFFTREDVEQNAVEAKTAPTFTVGAAIPITRNLRWDTDLVTNRVKASTVQAIVRFRLVY